MLNKFGTVLENADLTSYNTYGIKTSSKYLVKPDSIVHLLELLDYLNINNIKYLLLGKGSNVILPDTPFSGVIISLELLCNIEFSNNLVKVEAGVTLSNFIMECINKGLKGLEYLALIPGSLGGALYGNAGVKENAIYDNLVDITIIRDNKLVTLLKEEVEVGYRHTEFKDKKDVIVGATFKLDDGDVDSLKDIVKENRIKRLNSQPLEYKNAGSVFKNPEGDFAGRLIESLNLKGFSIGDAEVSNKHANFIINKGNATSNNIKELINVVKDKVYNEYKIELSLEQIIIDWD